MTRGRARRFPPSARRSWRSIGRVQLVIIRYEPVRALAQSYAFRSSSDREILAGIRSSGRSDGVETLRRLAVARLDLGTAARPAADRISAKEAKRPLSSCFEPRLRSSLKARTRIGDSFSIFLALSSASTRSDSGCMSRLMVTGPPPQPARAIAAAIAAGTSSALRRSREQRVG